MSTDDRVNLTITGINWAQQVKVEAVVEGVRVQQSVSPQQEGSDNVNLDLDLTDVHFPLEIDGDTINDIDGFKDWLTVHFDASNRHPSLWEWMPDANVFVRSVDAMQSSVDKRQVVYVVSKAWQQLPMSDRIEIFDADGEPVTLLDESNQWIRQRVSFIDTEGNTRVAESRHQFNDNLTQAFYAEYLGAQSNFAVTEPNVAFRRLLGGSLQKSPKTLTVTIESLPEEPDTERITQQLFVVGPNGTPVQFPTTSGQEWLPICEVGTNSFWGLLGNAEKRGLMTSNAAGQKSYVREFFPPRDSWTTDPDEHWDIGAAGWVLQRQGYGDPQIKIQLTGLFWTKEEYDAAH